ncbi:hypothetical protein Nepgr_021942 [Nepenthes gracilis]|uniref:Uncharacterized protein n=1 Tax=Nepenthes gracilis TaxID=150966 RepID=A0AAD3XXW4_NEPGR|nr:hypothetical protein Nepgr_021942 [Nepenthes gracilis]
MALIMVAMAAKRMMMRHCKLEREVQLLKQGLMMPQTPGEVTLKNLSPIYSRGNDARETDQDMGIMIPMRLAARRVKSLWQAILRSASFHGRNDLPPWQLVRFDPGCIPSHEAR